MLHLGTVLHGLAVIFVGKIEKFVSHLHHLSHKRSDSDHDWSNKYCELWIITGTDYTWTYFSLSAWNDCVPQLHHNVIRTELVGTAAENQDLCIQVCWMTSCPPPLNKSYCFIFFMLLTTPNPLQIREVQGMLWEGGGWKGSHGVTPPPSHFHMSFHFIASWLECS